MSESADASADSVPGPRTTPRAAPPAMPPGEAQNGPTADSPPGLEPGPASTTAPEPADAVCGPDWQSRSGRPLHSDARHGQARAAVGAPLGGSRLAGRPSCDRRPSAVPGSRWRHAGPWPAIRRIITASAMQARMQAVSTWLTSGARPVAALLAGGFGTWLGVRPTLIGAPSCWLCPSRCWPARRCEGCGTCPLRHPTLPDRQTLPFCHPRLPMPGSRPWPVVARCAPGIPAKTPRWREVRRDRWPPRVAHARAHAVDVVREWQIDDDIVEALRLIVSELVTNAVVHTVSRSIEITVSSPPLRPL